MYGGGVVLKVSYVMLQHVTAYLLECVCVCVYQVVLHFTVGLDKR